jgi:hypothetical protein
MSSYENAGVILVIKENSFGADKFPHERSFGKFEK